MTSASLLPFPSPSAPSLSVSSRPTRLRLPDLLYDTDHYAEAFDIRPASQRAFEGPLPSALVIERNVLEWRCDPTSDARLPQAVGDDVGWMVVCSEGYTSSLAAAALHELGLRRATDVIGGYRALAAAGVLEALATAGSPVSPGHADLRFFPESNLAVAVRPTRR